MVRYDRLARHGFTISYTAIRQDLSDTESINIPTCEVGRCPPGEWCAIETRPFGGKLMMTVDKAAEANISLNAIVSPSPNRYLEVFHSAIAGTSKLFHS